VTWLLKVLDPGVDFEGKANKTNTKYYK
jgi:hypothetical protein